MAAFHRGNRLSWGGNGEYKRHRYIFFTLHPTPHPRPIAPHPPQLIFKFATSYGLSVFLGALFTLFFFFFSFFCFHSFLLRRNGSWAGDSDRWLSALTLYPIQRRFHPIKNHLCTLKLNGSQAAERKGLPCVSELPKSNFLKAAAPVARGEKRERERE